MRGKRCFAVRYRQHVPITPADAGKTKRSNTSLNPLPDHPRGCGENIHAHAVMCRYAGSPPRMRGKQCDFVLNIGRTGITPADAGKTRGYTYSLPQLQDHPRGCGENSGGAAVPLCEVGSPPRMRGKRAQSRRNIGVRRITPADAGKTLRSYSQPS